MKNDSLKRLVISSMLLALGIVLPFFTGQIKEIGDSLLPMHLPVMLCGAICGWKYGLTIGMAMPIIRSVSFGMPPIYPNAVWMAIELATYGLVIGILYSKLRAKGTRGIILALIISMLAGRIAWGVSKAVLLGVTDKGFTMHAFLVGGFADAVPGIIIQLILVPVIVGIVEHTSKNKRGDSK